MVRQAYSPAMSREDQQNESWQKVDCAGPKPQLGRLCHSELETLVDPSSFWSGCLESSFALRFHRPKNLLLLPLFSKANAILLLLS